MSFGKRPFVTDTVGRAALQLVLIQSLAISRGWTTEDQSTRWMAPCTRLRSRIFVTKVTNTKSQPIGANQQMLFETHGYLGTIRETFKTGVLLGT